MPAAGVLTTLPITITLSLLDEATNTWAILWRLEREKKLSDGSVMQPQGDPAISWLPGRCAKDDSALSARWPKRSTLVPAQWHLS